MSEKREILRHVPELDGVRGIAVLLVMVAHFYGTVSLRMPSGLSRLVERGGSGVDLFFVLSGFLITGILVSSKPATNYFQAFYARRALRIFPLYIVVTGLFFLTLPLYHHFGKDLAMREPEQIWYWLFLQNWRQAFAYNDGAQLSHLWSLAVEEQFYLLWSVVAWMCSPQRLAKISVVLILVAMAGRNIGLAMGMKGPISYYSTFTRMDALLLGALIALSPRFRTFMGSNAKWILPVAVAVSLFQLPFELKFTVYGLGASALVALATTQPVAWLRFGWLRSTGKYSYGLYVLHYPICGAMAPFASRFNPALFAAVSIPLGLTLSYLAAFASWKVLESPFLSFKRYAKYRFAEAIPPPSRSFPAEPEAAPSL